MTTPAVMFAEDRRPNGVKLKEVHGCERGNAWERSHAAFGDPRKNREERDKKRGAAGPKVEEAVGGASRVRAKARGHGE